MKKTIIIPLLIISLLPAATQAAPILFFSDLIDGPNVGLTDSSVTNQGAIVTVWGRNLISGSYSSSTHKIYVGSAGSGWTQAAFVYCWANADGASGGGPANLYASHGMQEISFSVASGTATGAQGIRITTDDGATYSNILPFYVRTTGDIFFVKSTGSDTADGSWTTPWLTPTRAVSSTTSPSMGEGDIVYVCDLSVSGSTPVSIGQSARKRGTINNMMGIIAYPGALFSVDATGTGVKNYGADNAYWVVSKLSIDTDVTGIGCTRYGRVVGNKVTGTTADGSSGAIDGGYDFGWDAISAVKVLGNYVHDFGDSTTTNQHHTTYFRIRWDVSNVPGIEIAWNRLEDNKARFGIHYYDQSFIKSGDSVYSAPGSFNSPCYVYSNFVRNQGGAGINIGGSGFIDGLNKMTGTWYVYNNVLVNAGLTTNQGISCFPYAIAFYGEMNDFDIYLYNNTIHGYGDSAETGSVVIYAPLSDGTADFAGTWHWQNNIVVDTKDFAQYTTSNLVTPSTASNNIWYNGGDSAPAAAPTWDTSPIIEDPLFVNMASGDYNLQSLSPAVGAGVILNSFFTGDYHSINRGVDAWDIGAFEYAEGEAVPTPTPTPTPATHRSMGAKPGLLP